MRILNAACGGHRPPEPWVNLDTLKQQLKPGSPEMENLLKETNYVECDLLTQSIPFPDEYFDGLLLQHVLEHFTCHEAVQVLLSCRRVLKAGGLLVASVPDAEYFLSCYDKDTPDRAIELFGERISEPEHTSFFSYALWHLGHKQVLTASSLTCLLLRASFRKSEIFWKDPPIEEDMLKQLNRLKFSAILYAYK